MAAPLRSEINNEFKWAVNDIYSSDNVWEKDYQRRASPVNISLF